MKALLYLLDNPLIGTAIIGSLCAIAFAFVAAGMALGLPFQAAGIFAMIGLPCTMVILAVTVEDFLWPMPMRIDLSAALIRAEARA